MTKQNLWRWCMKFEGLESFNSSNNPKDRVKNCILDWFRKMNAEAGNVLSPRQFNSLILQCNFNPKEKKVIHEVINELVDEGLIEIKDQEKFVLTKKGEDFLY